MLEVILRNVDFFFFFELQKVTWNSRVFATSLFVHVLWIVTVIVWMRLSGTSGKCLINLSFSVQEPFPVEFWVSLGICIPQSSWETYFRVRPNQRKRYFTHGVINFLVFQFVSWLFLCLWVPVRRLFPCLLYLCIWEIYVHG